MLRGWVLTWIAWRGSHRKESNLGLPAIGQDDFNKVTKVLLALWHQATGTHSLDFLSSLDYRIGELRPEFRDSVEARDVWLAYLFAPIRGADADKQREIVKDRCRSVGPRLRALGQKHPAVVGVRLTKELTSKNWPLEYRVNMAGALHVMYEEQAKVDPKWEQALQAFYPAAIDSADAQLLRRFAGTLKDSPEWSRTVRTFRPNSAIEQSLERALGRMRDDLRKPKPGITTRLAASALEALLKQLEENRNKK
jgi:hypothetical protein